MIRKINRLIVCLMLQVLLISCKSKDERSIIAKIKKNNYVDLASFCIDFDRIVIFDEGYYYYPNNKDEWLGPKIYYLEANEVKKVINLRCCADEPYGDIIHFFPFQGGEIIIENGDDTVFYLTQIEQYKYGRILVLEEIKKDVKFYRMK